MAAEVFAPPQQTDLDSAIGLVRKAVEKQLHRIERQGGSHAEEPSELEALHRAVEEVNAAWDNLQAQTDGLAKQRNHYWNLFHLAHDAYVLTDGYGTILEVNIAAQELLLFRSANLIGKPLVLFVAMEDRPTFRTKLSEALATSSAKTLSCSSQYGPAPRFTIEFTVGPITPPGGAFEMCWVLRRQP